MDYFNEIKKHLVEDEKPSVYFNDLVRSGLFPKEYPYDIILKLKDVEQNPKYHPEGNVWNHTMLVVDEAALRKSRSVNPEWFMLAAFLHDVGKLTTTKLRKGRITSYDHEKVGADMVEDILKFWNIPEYSEMFNYIVSLVRLHMQVLFVLSDNGFQDYKLISKCRYIDDLGLLGACDRLGRGPKTDDEVQKEERNIEIFVEKCKNNIR